MITCKEATELASKGQDTPLSFKQRIQLQIHLCICKLCARYVRQLGFLRHAIHSLEKSHDDKTLSPEAKQRIKNSLTDRHDQ